jgi:uncharacterized protein YaaQ
MKMILAILRDEDTETVYRILVENDLRVSRIASDSDFLNQRKSTLMIGVEDDDVDKTIQLINKNCSLTIEPYLRRATLFVLQVDHFEKV